MFQTLKPRVKKHFDQVLKDATKLLNMIKKKLIRAGHQPSSTEFDLFVALHNVSTTIFFIYIFCLLLVYLKSNNQNFRGKVLIYIEIKAILFE